MTAVDALSCPNLATGGSCDPNQLLRKLIQAGSDNDHFDAWAGGEHAGLPHCLQATHCQPNPLGLKFPTYASVGRVLCRLSLVLSRSSSSGLSSSSAGCYGMNFSDSAK
jgi:hypothetical protein